MENYGGKIMYTITYGYYKRDKMFKEVGNCIEKHVDGKTLAEVNEKFHQIKDNHDITKYSMIYFHDVFES
jgi:hypothetical protein